MFYAIAILKRKFAKEQREMVDESSHEWMGASDSCRDDVCFFCGKVTDGWSFLCHRMHRIAGTWMTTPMKLSAMYEDEDIPIPCCEECLAASKVADAKAKRNIWIAALSACVAVFATLMYLFHGHPGAWIVAASLAFLAGMVSHSVAGWVAKPAYRKKIEKYIDGVRSKARAADAVSCESMPIGPAGLCRTIVLPGGVAMEVGRDHRRGGLRQMKMRTLIRNMFARLKAFCKKANCMDCPEHQLWAVPDPDDWFSSDTRISCRLAGGRTIADSVSGGYFRECAATPSWCPKRHKPSTGKEHS